MKKILEQYSDFFEPAIIITALIIALVGQSQLNLFFFWISFTLLLSVGLWRLQKPGLYFSLAKDKAFLAYSAFILWCIISTIYWSQVKVGSILTIFTFLMGLLSYFIGYTDNSKKSLDVQKILLVLGLGLAIYTYYQFYILDIKRPIGLFLNWNTHAAFLAMIVLPWVLRYALTSQLDSKLVWYIGIITLLFTFAMGLTQSRGALLILAIGFLGLSVIIRRQHLSFKNSLFLLSAVILGYMFSGFFVNETILERISHVTELQNYASTTGTGRHTLWLPAWEMYLDRPFLGWGLNAYAELFAQYKAPLTSEYGFFAHNDYLQFLLELGPVGLLLFLGFVFFIAQKLYYVLQKQEGMLSTNKIEAFVLLTPCIGMLAHTFFTFHLYQISMQIILGYYLGRAAKCVRIEQGEWADSSDLKDSFQITWIYRVICFALIIISMMSGFSSYHIVKAEKAKDYLEKIDHYLKAGLFFKALDKYDALSASHLGIQLQKIPVNDATMGQRQQIATFALTAVNSAIAKMPLEKWNYITKAEILRNMQGNYLEVASLYAKALESDPYLLEVRYHYAKLLTENGQNKQAMEILWAGWGILYSDYYQKAMDYLQFQQELGIKYGKQEDNMIIEQQILRLKKLMKEKNAGEHVFFMSSQVKIID